MKKVIVVGIFAVASATAALGWYFYEKQWGPEAQKVQARMEQREMLLDRVRSELKDPQSAQFKIYTERANYICGEVNAKNSMGGYVGSKYFVVEGSSVNFNPDAYAKATGSTYMCPVN